MKNILVFALLLLGAIAQGQPSAGDTSRINLLFVGDVMGHGPQIASAEVVKNKTYDYGPCFRYVAPIVQAADLAIANLEVTLPGRPPYKGYPQFRSPDTLAYFLYEAGFDLLVTSNNHSNDSGKDGVLHTIDVLQNAGFYQTGTFRSQAERDYYYPLIIYKGDFKLAILNYTYGTNGIPTTPPVVVNEINDAQIQADIGQAKLFQPDFIIPIMHWGDEYQLNENENQQQLAKKMLEWGADFVVGMHPHVVQPIKSYEVPQADGTSRPAVVAYSLGNFISAQVKTNTEGGLMFEIELLKDRASGKTALGAQHYIPVYRYVHRENGKDTFYVLPISAFEDGKMQDELNMPEAQRLKMTSFAKRMRTHLGKHAGQERKVAFRRAIQATN
jgi:poly-gamma-glutamate capsule biosynthesis protein CapA/YwtB (metallophosphatase superfamily)